MDTDTPLHAALLHNDLTTARRLIERREGIDARDEKGETALFLAAEYEGIVEALLGAGADANARNVNGETPLHEIAANGTPAQARALLRCGANVHATSNTGHTALHIAAAHGAYEIARVLIGAGAAVNASDTIGKTPLHYAVYGNIQNWEWEDHLQAARVLVGAGADPMARTNAGETALELAKRHYGYPGIAAFLESYGAK